MAQAVAAAKDAVGTNLLLDFPSSTACLIESQGVNLKSLQNPHLQKDGIFNKSPAIAFDAKMESGEAATVRIFKPDSTGFRVSVGPDTENPTDITMQAPEMKGTQLQASKIIISEHGPETEDNHALELKRITGDAVKYEVMSVDGIPFTKPIETISPRMRQMEEKVQGCPSFG
jgi:hypothetical protein